MFAEQELANTYNNYRQEEIAREITHNHLVDAIENKPSLTAVILANVGAWMSQTGQRLQQRYAAGLEVTHEPKVYIA